MPGLLSGPVVGRLAVCRNLIAAFRQVAILIGKPLFAVKPCLKLSMIERDVREVPWCGWGYVWGVII